MTEPETSPIRLHQPDVHQLRRRLGPQRPQKPRIDAEASDGGDLQQVPPGRPKTAGPFPDGYPHNVRQRRVLAGSFGQARQLLDQQRRPALRATTVATISPARSGATARASRSASGAPSLRKGTASTCGSRFSRTRLAHRGLEGPISSSR